MGKTKFSIHGLSLRATAPKGYHLSKIKERPFFSIPIFGEMQRATEILKVRSLKNKKRS